MNPAALEAAFRATTYRVETPEGLFDLRIGVADPALDVFLRRQGVTRWAIISADNPGAVPLSGEENCLRHKHLQERVKALGCRFFTALNLADAGDWPPEPGFLLLEIGELQGCALAREFSQLAVVCGETGCVPRLVWA